MSQEMKRVWVTPRLHSARWDETWHRTIDEAVDYVAEHLAEWIACRHTQEELERDGYSLTIESRLVSDEDYEAVFTHGETVS